MMAKEVRFGILGLGRGRKAAQTAIQTAGANLVCVCDLQEEKVKVTAQELDCDWTTSYDQMLARDDVDAIGVYTSSGTHADFANQAIAVGKHVFVTKPMDIDLDKCDRLIEAAKRANLVLAVDFIRRYRKTDHQVRQAVADGLIGNIILGDLRMKWYRSQSYYDGGWPPGWRSRSSTEGGSAANQGVHSIDQLQWFMGDVKTVQGRCGTFNHEIETEDCSVGILTFASGAFGMIQTTTCSYPSLGTTLQINGSKGTITMDKSGAIELMIEGQEEVTIDQVEIETDFPENIIEDMVGAIIDGQPIMVSGEEGRKSVAIFTAIYESSRTGSIVQL
ncbi:TPA: Gfo/Idh/MocA family oxidoreductase [Candidatus Poribacteria bacterium]|nr:Gfo/Idh/MocA family oxidoreductase [Candidatus Poribacteria bacterium]